MSEAALAWLNKIPPKELSHAEYRILNKLCWLDDPVRGYAWPGYTYLEKATGVSRGGISKAIAGMEERGFLTRLHGVEKSTAYRLNLGFTGVHSGNTKCSLSEQQVFTQETPSVHSVNQSRTVIQDSEAGQEHRGSDFSEDDPPSLPSDEALAASVPPAEKTKTSSERELFAHFWDAYPRKVGKGAARKAFSQALKKADVEVIAKGLDALIEERRGKDPKYTPHPATWLNQERWLDEAQTPEPSIYDKMQMALDVTAPSAHQQELEELYNGITNARDADATPDDSNNGSVARVRGAAEPDRQGEDAAHSLDGRSGQRSGFRRVRFGGLPKPC